MQLSASDNKGGFRYTFRALNSPNFRIFLSGHAISRVGTWMERTAVSWVVYEMTQSTLMLGITVFLSQLPSFLFSLYAGVLTDRVNRYKLVLFTQVASFIQASVLAFLAISGRVEIWHILTLITLLGVINAFDITARKTLLHQLIDRNEDLPNAIALNSSVVNIARLLGPAFSGIILSSGGAAVCFVINALSYLAVIVSLLFLKVNPQEIKDQTKGSVGQILEGLSYLKNHAVIGPLALHITLISLTVLPYNTLLPEFAKGVFHGDASTFGYISSSIGFGALAGTVFLASRSGETSKQVRLLLINTLVLGVSLILFSFVRNLPLALVIAAVSGFSALTQSTICLTVIQMIAAPDMRGRMISIYTMAFFGMLPFGSLLIGWLSRNVGSTETVCIEGAVAFVIAAILYRSVIKTAEQTSGSEVN